MQSRTTRERSAARHTEEPVARSDNRHGSTTAATFPPFYSSSRSFSYLEVRQSGLPGYLCCVAFSCGLV